MNNWTYIVDVRRFKEYDVRLYSGGPGTFWDSDLQTASKDHWVKKVNRTTNYGEDVFRLLVEIYALFMLPESAIPFTNKNEVTKENIINLNNHINGR